MEAGWPGAPLRSNGMTPPAPKVADVLAAADAIRRSLADPDDERTEIERAYQAGFADGLVAARRGPVDPRHPHWPDRRHAQTIQAGRVTNIGRARTGPDPLEPA